MTELKTFEYADTNFSNFYKDKDKTGFKVGKILSPAFKLCITRLESEPLSEDEIKWLFEEYPTSCARSRFGNSEDIEDLPMFSDLACSINENNHDAIKIFPLEEET
ncbi:hypothetical protein H5410_003777, partial [Solanum commersonii]